MENSVLETLKLLKQRLISSHDGLGLNFEDFVYHVLFHCTMRCDPFTNQHLYIHCPNRLNRHSIWTLTLEKSCFLWKLTHAKAWLPQTLVPSGALQPPRSSVLFFLNFSWSLTILLPACPCNYRSGHSGRHRRSGLVQMHIDFMHHNLEEIRWQKSHQDTRVATLSVFISVPLARIVPAFIDSWTTQCWHSLQLGSWLSGYVSSVLSSRRSCCLNLPSPADELYPPEPWLQQSF